MLGPSHVAASAHDVDFICQEGKTVKALKLVSLIALTFFLVTGAAVADHAAPAPRDHTYTCTGGNIPPGTYRSILVTGVCYMPVGTINVRKDLTVAPGALLDAVTPGDPVATPLLPATVLVGGDVSVGKGAVLFLGCSPNISCPKAVTYDRIGGNLTATGALGVVVHSVSIGGNFSLLGGGGGVIGGAETGVCGGNPATNTPAPVPPLWASDPSLGNGEGPGMPIPVYSDAEDNSIGGNLTIVGLQSCWLGSLRNQIGGSATIAHNTMGDPDAVEVENNLVGRDMTCRSNLPAVQFGDSGAAPNIVGRRAAGECGFGVVALNPPPEAMAGPGIPEHVAVSARSLGTYWGTHTQIGASVESVTFGTTTSGETLVGALNNDVLAGGGLTGTITVVPGSPTGSTGEFVLSTAHANGSSSFIAQDNCNCSFRGQAGTVTIRAYGTTSAKGTTSGTFLVISGGEGNGGLSTLAGYGTFTSRGEPAGTLRLVEHLRIT